MKDKIIKPFLTITRDKFTIDTIEDLKVRRDLKVGDVIELNGYYSAGDGANHKRVIAQADDGSGVQLANKLWANIVHNGEVNVSWFGALTNSNKLDLQKIINYGQDIVFPSGYFNIKNRVTVTDKNPIRKMVGQIDTVLNFDIQEGTALNIQTYFYAPFVIEGFRILNTNKTNNSTGVDVSLANKMWGACITMRDCVIEGFNNNILDTTEAFNATFYNCRFIVLQSASYVERGTLLRTRKTVNFGSNLNFENCAFWGARIGLHIESNCISNFTNCVFENLVLFNYCPVSEDDSIRNKQYFNSCWFENIQRGIINSEANLENFEIIKTLPRNDVKNIKMLNNQDGGNTPEFVLDKRIEPERYTNYSFTQGFTVKNASEYRRKEYNKITENVSVDDQDDRIIIINASISEVTYENRLYNSLVFIIVKAIGYNNNSITSKFIVSTFDDDPVAIGSVIDRGNIGLGEKISISKTNDSVNIIARGKGIRICDVVISN